MTTYRLVKGPPEEVILPIITSSIAQLLSEVRTQPQAPLRALDVGCGDQPLKPALLERGYVYHSCDHRQNQAASVEFVTAIDAPLPAAMLGAGPFSLLVCTEVLEHVFDWDAAFRNFADLVAPDGYVLVTCPFLYFPHEQPHDFWRPTTHAIRTMGERHGFQVVRAVESGSPWDVVRLILKSQLVMNGAPGLASRLAAFAVRQVCALTQAIYDNRWIRAQVTLRSDFYLNTAVLLQRTR